MSSTDGPVVSIFIPVFNGETYLSGTLDSLLHQTFKRFEIIIVNDGSTDSTLQISKEYQVKDTRIRVVTHEVRRGLSAARNTGWRSASSLSKYLMNHDSDDISLPTKLEEEVNILERHPEVGAVGCFCRYIDAQGKDIGFPPLEWMPHKIKRSFGVFNSLAISATLVRRKVFDIVGDFGEEFGGCDDYDFWSRMLQQNFHAANIPAFLHHIRKHEASYSHVYAQEMSVAERVIQKQYNRAMNISAYQRFWIRLSLKTLRYRMNRIVHTRVE
jgi:glycosyltransferase involved in cell wall biosynthesis